MTVLHRSSASLAAELGRHQREAVAKINARIGNERARYITVAPGQEMIYLAKEAEAARYVSADPEPATMDDYPLLAADVGTLVATGYEAAQLVLNLAAQWRQIGGQLEYARRSAIAAVEGATTPGEVQAALEHFEAAL